MEQVRLLAGSIDRWDEIKSAIDLDLARNPFEAGHLIPETALYAVTILSDPPLTLYYTADKQEKVITLVEVQEF